MGGKSKYLLAILCTMMPFFNAINAQDALTAVYWDEKMNPNRVQFNHGINMFKCVTIVGNVITSKLVIWVTLM